ncbi:competence protein ComEC [Microbacteriaceae bacterium SG_E_30_P1]|uniref:Competence protein ComEC n=1 Tax=Antiquaquibacter oligotrophicus TaxID=2880260 RepID=A0ABT6KPQ3_9MICO|nr:ComEC/Rec2 family competence protein [Antiquaquibacter oligotrophicus]MDH6181164.1 competence protein ComEC [Antiquaquibacter oligotrophicus]UDF13140.1 ComEC/Rec2 family competence protein [Antiquaquibacter oligotrophicus]
MKPIDLRLAIPAAVGWACAIVLVGLPELAWISAPALWALAGLLVAASFRWRVIAVVALAVLAAAVCSTAIAVQHPERQPSELVKAAGESLHIDLRVEATEVVVPSARAWEGRLIEADALAYSVPVIVFGATPSERTDIGTVVSLGGTLELAEPGDDRAFVVFPVGPAVIETQPSAAIAWANGLRDRFLAVAVSLPGPGGELLPGLAIGDTTAVSTTLDDSMVTSSLSHLTAVSGANCAVVIGLIMLVGGALGLPRAARIGLSLAALVGFVILVTPQPSVLRAATMAAIVLVLLGVGRPVRGLPILSLAVIVLLAVDPWLARSYGFALSALATAGLLLLAGPLAERLSRWMPRPLALVIAVPTAAQFACQPVIVLLDPSLPLYGVVANILAAPAAPVATIVGMVACLVLPVLPSLGGALCWIAWLPSSWIAAVADFFARLPGSRLPWLEGLPGVILLGLVSALAVAALLGGAPTRRRAIAVLAASALLYTATVGIQRAVSVLGRPADWQIAACDIGQGDAVVFRSGSEIALVDTGPEPDRLERCLDDLGVSRIDLLVLTHFDHDHVGGATAVLGRVDRVIVGPTGEPKDATLLDALREAGARVEEVRRGSSGLLGAWRWSVMWPAGASAQPGNAASVVTQWEPVEPCRPRCLSAIMLGDLGEQEQTRLLALGSLAHPDVVGVAHHGSADQAPQLYLRLRATVGVIGVGADNGYGHPTEEALAALADAGTAVERTDRSGMVMVATAEVPGQLTVWRQHSGGDGGDGGGG